VAKRDHRACVRDEARFLVWQEGGGEPEVREFRAVIERRRGLAFDLGREDREPLVLAEQDQLVEVDAGEWPAVERQQAGGRGRKADDRGSATSRPGSGVRNPL
jgi:hypothetical protein